MQLRFDYQLLMLIKPVFLSSQILIFQKRELIFWGGGGAARCKDKLVQLHYIKGLNRQYRMNFCILNIKMKLSSLWIKSALKIDETERLGDKWNWQDMENVFLNYFSVCLEAKPGQPSSQSISLTNLSMQINQVPFNLLLLYFFKCFFVFFTSTANEFLSSLMSIILTHQCSPSL